MSSLRLQLHSAREGYHSARYPGDLAELLPPSASPRRITPAWRTAALRSALALAAAVMLLITGFAIDRTGAAHSLTSWQSYLPTANDLALPREKQMSGAVKTITPPEVPGLLMEVKQPLESSGKFIVNLGKDVAHHADAFFHMG